MEVSRERGRLTAALATLPSGTIPVGAGLLVNGVATYVFQILAFRMLGSVDYAALNGLWVTTVVLAPGLFLPLEQEVARALAHRKARGQGGRPLIITALGFSTLLVLGVVAVLLLARSPIEERLLRSADELFPALIIVLVGFAIMSLARGTLSGNGRFGRYGIIVGMDGLGRAVLAAGLAFLGFATLGWLGLVFAVVPYIAVLFGLAGARGLAEPGPPAPVSELSTAIGWLLLGSTFAQALSYSAYIGASLLASPAQNAALGAFIAGIFIARIPLLLFQAVQAALLPKLAGLLGEGRVQEFRTGLFRLVVIVLGASVVGVLVALTIAPAIGRVLFGENFTLTGVSLATLTAGVCLMVTALTLAQALIALRRYAVTALAWVASVAVFVVIMLLVDVDIFVKAELAFVAGAAVALVWMGTVAYRATSGSELAQHSAHP
ncbi:MAG: lipopolysaccharide biosynthesis protein [Candidatus Nanopelagicaceae bacterium]